MPTLIRIGNSQGVRIPKTIIEQARLDKEDLEFKVVEEGLLIQSSRTPRYGWHRQFEEGVQTRQEKEQEQEWLDASLVEDADWQW